MCEKKEKNFYTRDMAFLICFALLVSLFFLSRFLTRLLSRLLLRLFHNQSVVVHVLSFFFLPGVVLHELSHLLFANLLLVRTGEVEFFPEIRGTEVKMGSVAIAKTDPLRRFLVGVAPLLGGLGILLLAFFYLVEPFVWWKAALLLYIVFQITNTMFASSKDMEGAIGFGIGVFVIAALLQLVGVPLVQGVSAFIFAIPVNTFFMRLDMFLFLALGLDVLSLFAMQIALSFRKTI